MNKICQMTLHNSHCRPEGNVKTNLYSSLTSLNCRSLERVNERVINFDLIVEVLYGIIKESMFRFNDDARLSFGAILIFLPGLGEIRALCERLSSTREFGQKDKYDLLPMHSKVSAKDQRRVFAPSRSGMRKIIVSTNIAETSVTIPDVTFGKLSVVAT